MLFPHNIELFIRQNAVGLSSAELMAKVNNKFCTNYSETQIKNFKSFKKIRSGVKTHINPKRLPIGSEYIKDGYLKIKIAEPHEYINKGRFVWEQVNGKVPDGYRVKFLDGDGTNCNLSNLALVSDIETMQLVKYGRNSGNKELTKAQINVVRLKNKIKQLSKEK